MLRATKEVEATGMDEVVAEGAIDAFLVAIETLYL